MSKITSIVFAIGAAVVLLFKRYKVREDLYTPIEVDFDNANL